MREALRDELAIQRVQQGSVMRDISITEREIDNFMATEEGEAMIEPEYRVEQALVSISRSDSDAERAAKEDFVDGVLANILAGAAFAEAVSVIEPYEFRGGDLGWRKLSDIPSMFGEIVPNLKPGQTGKVQSSSGLHLVHLAEARGIERLVEQTNVRHILVKPNEVLDDDAAREFIASLKQRIEDGEDFAELAKEHSDDIGSAQEGGELGWTNPGQMVAEFESAMAGAEINVLTDPIRSEFGWHILEVTDRRTENFAEQVRRNQVANFLRESKYEEELENWLREIREEAFVDIK
jgi:peptidyl-prolyl cis-trans isomerase SurA